MIGSAAFNDVLAPTPQVGDFKDTVLPILRIGCLVHRMLRL